MSEISNLSTDQLAVLAIGTKVLGGVHFYKRVNQMFRCLSRENYRRKISGSQFQNKDKSIEVLDQLSSPEKQGTRN